MKAITTKVLSIAGLLAILCVASGFGGCDRQTKIKGATITTDPTTITFTRHTVTGITTPLPVNNVFTGFPGAAFLTIGDIDGDNITEIICTSGIGFDKDSASTDGAVGVFTWDGDNASIWQQNVINKNFAFPNGTLIRDMDKDGNNDIMVLDNFLFGGNAGGIYWLRNLGGDIKSPANWELKTIWKGNKDEVLGRVSYHSAIFMDMDGDGKEDFITAKVSSERYFACTEDADECEQFAWTEWWKSVDDTGAFTGPYEIAEAGGFYFTPFDVDGDGDLDLVVPQFFNAITMTCKVFSDKRGDALLWLENPGTITTETPVWKHHTIDNPNRTKNTLFKAEEVLLADMDNDGVTELMVGTHNHQDYIDGDRLWPSGIYVLDIPGFNPRSQRQWKPITIDRGNPDLDPTDAAAVAADPYAVDRVGGAGAQGSPGLQKVDDINGDGFPDIVVPGDGRGVLYYYESLLMDGGTLQYRRATLYEDPGCMPGEAEIADINRDGKMDIVVSVYDTSVSKSPANASSSIFVFIQN